MAGGARRVRTLRRGRLGRLIPARRKKRWWAHLATPIDKYRITFALPWEDMLLLGTTDEEYEG
ncbi:hypothetical protein, partial [Streptomyces sp. NPDC013489]|uniref:hypothetical protein n=1 Tax=Streptomyces sp. NPDC013489 TaxID=3155606 RepID=UPI0033CB81AA